MTVLIFWIAPCYVIARSFYAGWIDGLAARALGKVWAILWATVLAVVIFRYVNSSVRGTACDRFDAFFVLWLLTFSVIHACGVFLVKRYKINQKIHDWLEAQPAYAIWRVPDRLAGGLLEALAMLALAFYLTRSLDSSFPAYTPYKIIEDGVSAVNAQVSDFLGLTGPGFMSPQGKLDSIVPNAAQNQCFTHVGSAPWAWAGFVFFLVTGPLAVVVCLQPVLYMSDWIEQYRRYGFSANKAKHACRACGGRGIHLRNPLLFGTPCKKCQGTGWKKKKDRKLMASDDARARDRPGLALLIGSYVWFMAVAVALLLLIGIVTFLVKG